MKDYGCEINYQLGKANVEVDAFSRKMMGQVGMLTTQSPLWKEFERLNLEFVTAPLNVVA